MLGHMDIYLFYRVSYIMSQRFSIEDIENMMPYERDIFFEMMADDIAKANKGD